MQVEDNIEMQANLDTAVLFLVFNRIEPTKKVFSVIKGAKPLRLYIASDGARLSKKNETARVDEVRHFLENTIDWDCEVKTLFRTENLGCKTAVASAIDWFFEHEESGIILEDDCLPSLGFFRYCTEMLSRYHEDERVFMISGYNRQNTWKDSEYDYFFSHHSGIWGWATWRRAWKLFDPEMQALDSFTASNGFENLLGKKAGRIRQKEIERCRNKHIDSWAYPWTLTMHTHAALACVPSKSLTENIGFGMDATHTFGKNDDGVTRHSIDQIVRHNPIVAADKTYDDLYLTKRPLITRVLRKIEIILLATIQRLKNTQ